MTTAREATVYVDVAGAGDQLKRFLIEFMDVDLTRGRGNRLDHIEVAIDTDSRRPVILLGRG